MPMRYEKHLDMKTRSKQAKTLWQAFLKDQVKGQKRKSRRKYVKNTRGAETRGGKEYRQGDDPNFQTDYDELGTYDYWGAT